MTIGKWLLESWDAATEEARNDLRRLFPDVERVLDEARERAEETRREIKETKDKIKKVRDDIDYIKTEAVDTVEDIDDIWDETGEKLQDRRDAVVDAAEGVKDSVETIDDKVKAGVDKAVKDLKKDAKRTAREALWAALVKNGDPAAVLIDGLSGALGKAGRTVGGAATGAIRDVFGSLDKLENTVRDNVTGAIRDVVGAGASTVARVNEALRGIGAAAERVIDAIGSIFGDSDADSAVQSCPGSSIADGGMLTDDGSADCSLVDGANTGSSVQDQLAAAKAAAQPSNSACCQGRPDQQSKYIYYVNGIGTDRRTHCQTIRRLREISCARVVGVFNDTEGFVTDIRRVADAREFLDQEMAGASEQDYPGFSPAVDTLKEVMTSEIAAGNEVNLVAHSEGGLISSLAAHRAISALEYAGLKDQIHNINITSMGSAAPAWPNGPTYTHYIHSNDFTPVYVGLGPGNDHAGQTHDGQKAEVIRFKGSKDRGFEIDPTINIFDTSFKRDHSISDVYLEYYRERTGGCSPNDEIRQSH